jgi:threonyl-tRNA synthetase
MPVIAKSEQFKISTAPAEIVVVFTELTALRAQLNKLGEAETANFGRMDANFLSNKINGKIQDAELVKVHRMLVIGNRDVEAGNVSDRIHGKGILRAVPKGKEMAEISAASGSGEPKR